LGSATVKKYSGFDPDEPLPLEPIEWTPLQEGTVLAIRVPTPDLERIEPVLMFDMVLAEPAALRKTAAAIAMTMLTDSIENTIKTLILLA
jgi:hypothetical protein